MARSSAKTVPAYLKELPPDRRKVVSTVRDVVLKNLPKGYEELIGFGMIMYSIPLKRFPDTYNGKPLLYVALAAQKNYYAIYLMAAYTSAAGAKKFQDEYRKTGKKLDMGKSCVRFKSLDDLPLDLIGKTVASTTPDEYIAFYAKAKAKK